MKQELLRIDHVHVVRDGEEKLRDLNMWIGAGEIVGLTATDRHGLNTFLELIEKNLPLVDGHVYFEGQPVNSYLKPGKGDNKVYIINNKSKLIPALTVADNVLVLRKGFRKYVISERVLETQVQETFDQLGISICAAALADRLTTYERLVVELIKAVLSGRRLIVLVGISEILGFDELNNFYDLLRYYAGEGFGILYIGNHHEEVFRICNRFLLYQSGKIIKTVYAEDMDDAHITPFVEQIKQQKTITTGARIPVLAMRSVTTGKLKNLTFTLYRGECLTVLDRDNYVMAEFLELLKGRTPEQGSMEWGKELMIIPEDPLNNYLFRDQSYLFNLSFDVDKKVGKSVIPRRIKDSILREWETEIGDVKDVKTLESLPKTRLYDLICLKILLYHPPLVVLVQPFSGVDMHMRIHIADLIWRLKEARVSVLLLTSYVADTLAVTDEMILLEKGIMVSEEELLKSQFIKNNYYKDRFIK